MHNAMTCLTEMFNQPEPNNLVPARILALPRSIVGHRASGFLFHMPFFSSVLMLGCFSQGFSPSDTQIGNRALGERSGVTSLIDRLCVRITPYALTGLSLRQGPRTCFP